MSKKWSLHPLLAENSAKYCCTLLIEELTTFANESYIKSKYIKSGNGTLTLVEYNGKTYGITCWHVIEIFRNLNRNSSGELGYAFYTMVPEPKWLNDSFERVYSDFEDHLDIGIAEIDQNRINFMGKETLILKLLKLPENLKFAIAVGFPERLKYGVQDRSISLPHVEIVAEREDVPKGRFTISSNLDKPHPYYSYSGMSGGPVFWCNKNDFGIIGIARSVETHESYGRKTISVACELAIPNEIIYWIEQYEKHRNEQI